MRHCVASGLLFFSLLGLWFMGVVPSLGVVIGMLSLLGFVAVTSYVKPSRLGKVATLFYTALIALIALNAAYSLVPESIKEEIGLIRSSETIKTAEQLHQPGGKTFQVIREQCKADFDKGLKEATDRLHQSTSPDKTEDLIQDVQKLEERREKCSNAIIELSEKGSIGGVGQIIGLKDMYTYLIGTWHYRGSRHDEKWTSWNYTFTQNGFLLEDSNSQEPSKYQFLSRDTLQIMRWDKKEKYRIMIVDHDTMQLILPDNWRQKGYSLTMIRINSSQSQPVAAPATNGDRMPFGLDKEWRIAWYMGECSREFEQYQSLEPSNRDKLIQACTEKKEEMTQKK